MKYRIKIGKDGYYGTRPFVGVPKDEATVFESMKEARKTLNRLNGRLLKGQPRAAIQPI